MENLFSFIKIIKQLGRQRKLNFSLIHTYLLHVITNKTVHKPLNYGRSQLYLEQHLSFYNNRLNKCWFNKLQRKKEEEKFVSFLIEREEKKAPMLSLLKSIDGNVHPLYGTKRQKEINLLKEKVVRSL